MSFIYSVFPTKKEAVKIAEDLVRAKLAACVNFWPIDSIYHWNSKIEKAKEYAGLIKTTKKNFKAVESFILKHHSYEVPCIIEIPAGRISRGYQKYLWQIFGE